MKQRIVSILLALCMVLALVPTTAEAASLPDWYFLFAIFKNIDADVTDENGEVTHVKYTMAQDEINVITDHAKEFEEYMNSVGVMRAHVDVVEISTPIKELDDGFSGGSALNAEQAAQFLKDKVNLDEYDHVTCIVDLDTNTSYAGLTSAPFENGTGQSCVNVQNRENCLKNWTYPNSKWTLDVYVHEFLHFMERMNRKWGAEFVLHDLPDSNAVCYTDLLLNQARVKSGTGVLPVVWQYPPHVLRTMKELTVPSGVTSIGKNAFNICAALTKVTISGSVTSIDYGAFVDCAKLAEVTILSGVTSIGDWAFGRCSALTKVTIPGSVTSIGYAAFWDCAELTEVTILSGVTSIGDWAFGRCSALTKVTIPASVTSIGDVAFSNAGIKDVYYTGTEAQWKKISIGSGNEPLTKATIHYNTSCTVTFDTNDGSGDVTIKLYQKNAALGTLPTPTRDGYKFDGWYTTKTGGTKVTKTRKVTKDVTFYAHWTRLSRTCLVNFDPNGGDIYLDRKIAVPGMAYGALPTPTRPGYIFKGWFTTKTGKTRVKETTTAGLTATQTLYAQWQESATQKSKTSGKWTVTIPAYYELVLYATATTAKISGRAPEMDTAQTITCTQKASLSTGVVRYYAEINGKNVWFTYSCEMDVESSPENSGSGKIARQDIFEGEWKDDKYDGQGKLTYANGDVYEGEFKDFKLISGTITKILDDGIRIYYESSNFVNDKMNGQGTETIEWTSGDVRVRTGMFKDGKLNGQGTQDYTWPNGDTFHYEGAFVDSEFNGQGTQDYTWPSGVTAHYEGTFVDSKFYNGIETTYNADGSVRSTKTYVNGQAN